MPNPTGKHSINFQYRNQEPDHWIGCNKCDGCTHSKKLEWAIRMHHESIMHSRNSFVTFTYSDDHLPEAINKRDPQLFLKLLRKHWPTPIRYFLTGEYGEKTRRPHYHAVIFGEDFLGGAYKINEQLYGNHLLNRLWKLGHCTVGNFGLGAAMYVAGYTAKKINDNDTFSIMSRKPPIGASWLKKNYKSIYNLEKVIVEGQEYPIPSAYLRWLDGDTINDKLNKEAPPRLTDYQLNSKQKNFDHKKRNSGEKI